MPRKTYNSSTHPTQLKNIILIFFIFSFIQPCGACTEWLKKIAEVNPAFAVVTFTDANCTGVYVEQIKD